MAHQTIEITVLDDGELKVRADIGLDTYGKIVEITDLEDPDGSARAERLQAIVAAYFELRRQSLANETATV